MNIDINIATNVPGVIVIESCVFRTLLDLELPIV